MESIHFLRSGRKQSLKCIQDAIESKDSGPAIRNRALKALSEFAQADPKILSIPAISGCFERSLKVGLS